MITQRSRLFTLLLLAFLLLPHNGVATDFVPFIVNGTSTFSYPAVGLLLFYDDATLIDPAGFCTGTLIGCRTFLTAAHCVCPEASEDARSCEQQGVSDPRTLRLLFQHGGFADVQSVAVDPDYQFAVAGDLAIVTLKQPVTGIAPLPINELRRPDIGQRGVIVGFGNTGAGMRRVDDAGIKRDGRITTGACSSDIPGDTNLCWDFQGADASTCEGDSGGPLFIDLGDGLRLAGVTSGGSSFSCMAPDAPFDTDTFVARDWIIQHAGDDLGTTACGSIAPIGQSPSQVIERGDTLAISTPQLSWQFNVPAGSAELRAVLNGQLSSGQGPSSTANDFDLFVAAGATAGPDHFDCSDVDPSAFGACTITAPTPGPWTVTVVRERGVGPLQMTISLLLPKPCAGDCDANSEVTIDEIIVAVSVALGTRPASDCLPSDLNGDGTVTVDEIVSAINRALNGCG